MTEENPILNNPYEEPGQSHPFPVKKGQKIAVRVISQFGEDTTKVLEVK